MADECADESPTVDPRTLEITKSDIYHAVSARRVSFDSFRWQAPLIAITGQSFLFAIILAGNVTTLARCIASALSAGVSIAFLVVLQRIKTAEHYDAGLLASLEGTPDASPYFGKKYKADLGGGRSHPLVMLLMGLFLLAAVVAFTLALAAPQTLTFATPS